MMLQIFILLECYRCYHRFTIFDLRLNLKYLVIDQDLKIFLTIDLLFMENLLYRGAHYQKLNF